MRDIMNEYRDEILEDVQTAVEDDALLDVLDEVNELDAGLRDRLFSALCKAIDRAGQCDDRDDRHALYFDEAAAGMVSEREGEIEWGLEMAGLDIVDMSNCEFRLPVAHELTTPIRDMFDTLDITTADYWDGEDADSDLILLAVSRTDLDRAAWKMRRA